MSQKTYCKIIGDDLYIEERYYTDGIKKVGIKAGSSIGGILHYKRLAGVWTMERVLLPTPHALYGDGQIAMYGTVSLTHLPAHNLLVTRATFGTYGQKIIAWDIS